MAVIVVKLVVIEPWKALVNLPRFFFAITLSVIMPRSAR